MDIVWLKRDVRWHDHGPLAEVSRSGPTNTKVILLYLYEPDQLRHPTVHGSHLRFIHEGLLDFERKVKFSEDRPTDKVLPDVEHENAFSYLTICHNTAIETLNSIHKIHKVSRILSHEETGHWQSYMRDRAVRKWCKTNGVILVEFNQTGVTRCLKNRDDYSKRWKAFMNRPRHLTPNMKELRRRILQVRSLPGFISQFAVDDSVRWDEIFTEVPSCHRNDRSGRQQLGGETKALATLDSFLQERGSRFQQDISSPNTAWNSCSRLSPYLAWGHVSLRYILYALQQRRNELKQRQSQGRNTGTWLKSLQAFSSRLHWRSHFVQKLESEPTMELRDLCPAYQHLRRQEGDWNEAYYRAWETGTTGFPFVDACMRCLLEHGWINFRMRAMLVSFATYNLWLDWKRIAPHLARVFLDFEPGIHYPQLQMQAGTTGINAMRVYNVTKQGKDHDPTGKFIRRHVRELDRVPNQYIHEPWKMPDSLQQSLKIRIASRNNYADLTSEEWVCYLEPIVYEQEAVKVAKAKLADVRKQESTKRLANEVFVKHGSRNHRSHQMNGRLIGTGALPAVNESMAAKSRQPKLRDAFAKIGKGGIKTIVEQSNKSCKKHPRQDVIDLVKVDGATDTEQNDSTIKKKRMTLITPSSACFPKSENRISETDGTYPPKSKKNRKESHSWDCVTCTFRNENKPYALVCGMCGTNRREG